MVAVPSKVAAANDLKAASDLLGINGESAARQPNQRDTLRRAAASLLYDSALPAKQQHPTVWCGRTLMYQDAGIYRRRDGCGARLAGVLTCGMVWTCPVCSLQLAQVRRAELTAGMAHWAKLGGHVYLMTQTFRHHRDDELPELLKQFAKAQRSFKQSTVYKRIAAQVDRRGGVRSLETTWGAANGWHPHSHELLFYMRDLLTFPGVRLAEDEDGGRHFVGGIVTELRTAWLAALARAGLDGTEGRAFDIRPGDYAAQYVAKLGHDIETWNVQDELTTQHAKVGRLLRYAEHYTPFQMIAMWSNGDGEHLWGDLVREFAQAFRGQRMMFWSPKLKELLGVRDKTDEQIAAELGRDTAMPDEDRIAKLSIQQFAVVYSRGAVRDLLDLARFLSEPSNAQLAVDEYVEWLKGRPRVCQERMRYRRWARGGDGLVEYNPREWVQ
jgi:hypothetical protein